MSKTKNRQTVSQNWACLSRRFRDLLHISGVRRRLANSLINELFHKLRLWKTSGDLWIAKRLKQLQHLVLIERPSDGWISVDPVKRWIKGFPRLSNLWKLGEIQVVMSVLNFHREMTTKIRIDVTSIVTPGIPVDQWYNTYGNSFNKVLLDLKNEVGKFKNASLDRTRSQITETPSLKLLATEGRISSPAIPLHYSSKMGPVGHQLKDCKVHAAAALQDPELGPALRDFSKAMGLDPDLLSPWGSSVTEGKTVHSRLVGLNDKSCKTRVVAIGDYISQSLLFPLHKSLMTILRNLTEDGTYDQNKAVRQLSENSSYFGSVDLKSATDRLPVDLQKKVIDCLFPGLGDPWSRVMRDRSFVCPGRKPVKYQVGQPMGLLSSWAAMALTHHCLVRLGWEILGRKFKYRILGDDIVICDERGSHVYMEIMRDLGVTLSDQTFLSPDRFTFAKKSYLGGKSVSPLSWAVARQLRNHLAVPSVLEHVRTVMGVKPHFQRVLNLFSGRSRRELWILLNGPTACSLCSNTTRWMSDKDWKKFEEDDKLRRLLSLAPQEQGQLISRSKKLDGGVTIPWRAFSTVLGLELSQSTDLGDIESIRHPMAYILRELLLLRKAYREIWWLYEKGPKVFFAKALTNFRGYFRFWENPASVQALFRDSVERWAQKRNAGSLLVFRAFRLKSKED